MDGVNEVSNGQWTLSDRSGQVPSSGPSKTLRQRFGMPSSSPSRPLRGPFGIPSPSPLDLSRFPCVYRLSELGKHPEMAVLWDDPLARGLMREALLTVLAPQQPPQ